MPTSLRQELRQQKPFASLHEETFLNIVRTATVLHDGMDEVLGAHALSQSQYNVLRMLRGAGDAGLCRNEIRDRMVTRMPDVSRLLDRMEAAGLVQRVRSTEDRRLVHTTLTTRGRRLVDQLDAGVLAGHERLLGHLTAGQLKTLIELLTLARGNA